MNQEVKKKPNPTPSEVPLQDHRYPIWGRVFLCKVPRIAHYGVSYLERYGLPSSGNAKVDRELMGQMSPSYITIDQMVEFYHEQTTISIVHKHDVKTVYEICQDYTFDWARSVQRSTFTSRVPFADLVKIDEFAEAVYQYAGFEYGMEFARSFLPNNLQEEIADLNKMFEAIDKRVGAKKKEKHDHYTVYNQYSTKPKREVDNNVVYDEDRPKLPERPTVRDVFLSYMETGGFGGRL